MRISAVIGVAFALAVPALTSAAELDRTLAIGGSNDLRVMIVHASVTADANGKLLSVTADPGRPLSSKEAQAAAERLFDDYAMASATRRGVNKVSIYVSPTTLQPRPREVREHTSTFADQGRGAWSLTNRWAVSRSNTTATRRLDDGTRIRVERNEIVSERMDGVAMPTMRVDILIDGLNPMLESDEIYTMLKGAWSQLFHQQALDAGIRSVELSAHVNSRETRFQIRDTTMLQLVASDNGAFPPLPVFPEGELKAPSLVAPAGASGNPEARFGHLDVTRFDRILDSGFAGLTPPNVETAPLALLSR